VLLFGVFLISVLLVGVLLVSVLLVGVLLLRIFFLLIILLLFGGLYLLLDPGEGHLHRLAGLEGAQIRLVAGDAGIGTFQLLELFLGVLLGIAHVVVGERQEAGPHVDVGGHLDLDVAIVLLEDVGA